MLSRLLSQFGMSFLFPRLHIGSFFRIIFGARKNEQTNKPSNQLT
jgi:hypothetical protein